MANVVKDFPLTSFRRKSTAASRILYVEHSSSKVSFFFSGMEAGRNVEVVAEDVAVL